MKPYDFSCKHDVLLRDEDGTLRPMDEPYFRAEQIAPGTWRILSDGDYSYLVEGDDEALAIDSGYGCGNIQEFCQSLTDKPVRRIANTHDHFDHTANNGRFERAYMSAATKELATRPFPSFAGIDFPRDYPIEVIDEGYVFHLGGRDVVTYAVHNHAVGSLLFLDKRERILFSGDELIPFFFAIKTPLNNVIALLTKFQELEQHCDRIFGGAGQVEKGLAGRYLEAVRYLMDGHWDEGGLMPPRPLWEPPKDGPIIFDRREARPCDMPQPGEDDAYQRALNYQGCMIFYDIRLKDPANG